MASKPEPPPPAPTPKPPRGPVKSPRPTRFRNAYNDRIIAQAVAKLERVLALPSLATDTRAMKRALTQIEALAARLERVKTQAGTRRILTGPDRPTKKR